MTQAIHQMLKTIVPGDAISSHTLAIRDTLRTLGYQSEIFVETCHPSLVSETYPIDSYYDFSSSNTILIFHFSQGTWLADYVLELPDRLILIYHNITPEVYFRRVHHEAWLSLIQGREQLPRLTEKAIMGLADSEFNRVELMRNGCEKTGVLPIILDFNAYNVEDSDIVLRMFPDQMRTILFVGRVTPNKGHFNLLKFFYYYCKLDQAARLIVVGQYYGFEPYYYLLHQAIKHLKLENVHFVGHVSHRELCTYYRLANVFTCFSLHEGFCVPLVESMYFQLPIVALSGTAIEDTLDKAGIIFNTFDPPIIAETVYKLLMNTQFRNDVIESQQSRLTYFERPSIVKRLEHYIQMVTDNDKNN